MKPFQIYLHLLLFLSSTATPPALAKYAKTGCNDKCGNVTIPYPFGLVAECSINKWYIIDCKDSTPYLSALKGLKVLGVDLRNQTVTVSMPRISDCQNQVRNSNQMMSFDLGDSPFLFSKLHNK
ncbi:putative wall-associated receptor kinase, galacturonan-binding domain-containing protein [Helianthus debilis subsp. tardiflorus]